MSLSCAIWASFRLAPDRHAKSPADTLASLLTRPDNGFNEIPTGQSAHDSFWDFISLMPESTNMIAWQLSDRTIPRSLRHMQGFGVNTFVLVTKEGKRTYVK